MKFGNILAAVALPLSMGLTLAACSEDIVNLTDATQQEQERNGNGEPVNFSFTGDFSVVNAKMPVTSMDEPMVTSLNVNPETRVHYFDGDTKGHSSKLVWDNGDDISLLGVGFRNGTPNPSLKIFSGSTSPFTYKLSNISSENHSVANLTAKTDPLRWITKKDGESADPYNRFFAVYPAVGDKIVSMKETLNSRGSAYYNYSRVAVTYNIQSTQYCKNPHVVAGDTKTVYYTEPDMTNCYMVGHSKSVLPSSEPVKIDMKPIVTTIVMRVTAGNMEEDVRGIRIRLLDAAFKTTKFKSKYTSKYIQDNNYWKSYTDGTVTNPNTQTNDPIDGEPNSLNTNICNETEPTTDATDVDYIDVLLVDEQGKPTTKTLAPGQSIEFTAFLPPLKYGNDSKKGTNCSLHIEALAGGGAVQSAGKFTGDGIYVTPSSKTIKELPALRVINGSNWMSYLPETALIRDLTLPGSHRSGVYMTKADQLTRPNIQHTAQNLSILHQLENGVRVFDFRITNNGASTTKGWFVQADYGVDTPTYGPQLIDAVKTIRDWILAHPTETAIIIGGREPGGDTGNQTAARSALYTHIASILEGRDTPGGAIDAGKAAFSWYKPDLTLKDCRKHVLYFVRPDNFDNYFAGADDWLQGAGYFAETGNPTSGPRANVDYLRKWRGWDSSTSNKIMWNNSLPKNANLYLYTGGLGNPTATNYNQLVWLSQYKDGGSGRLKEPVSVLEYEMLGSHGDQFHVEGTSLDDLFKTQNYTQGHLPYFKGVLAANHLYMAQNTVNSNYWFITSIPSMIGNGDRDEGDYNDIYANNSYKYTGSTWNEWRTLVRYQSEPVISWLKSNAHSKERLGIVLMDFIPYLNTTTGTYDDANQNDKQEIEANKYTRTIMKYLIGRNFNKYGVSANPLP